MKSKIFTLFLSLLSLSPLIAQNGPGGVGDTTGTTNLQLWLRADDLLNTTQDGAPVLLWEDQSGAENHVFGSSSTAPAFVDDGILGYSGLEFKDRQYLQTNGARSGFNNPESSIFVVKQSIFRGTSIAIASNGWSNEMLLFNYNQYHHSSSGNFWFIQHQCLRDIPDEEIAIVCGIFGQTPTDLRYFVNGLESTRSADRRGTPSNYVFVDRKVTIGQRDQFVPSEYYQGYILEVIVYNDKLSDADRESVQEYLRCKYDMLPAACTALDTAPCTPSANSQQLNNFNILLAPNPVQQFINISLENDNAPKNTAFQVYDQLGRLVDEGTLIDGTAQISTLKFAQGIYYLRLNIEGERLVEKFLVN